MKTEYPVALHFRFSRQSLVALLLAVCYALMVVIFPWETISRGGFPDFDNYVYDYDYLISQNDSTIELHNLYSIVEFFTNEVVWVELVRGLTGLTKDASIALRIISFFILFVWAQFLFRRVSYGVALLFLLNPFAIDVAMSGIRNGLAWSLVILGLTNKSNSLRAALFLIGIFVHSTTLVLAFFYYFTKLARRYANNKILLINALGIGIFVGLAVTVGRELVFSIIGDRRLDENYLVGGGSFLQASLWAVLLYFQCISGLTYIKNNMLIIAVLAWYLTLNPFIPWSFRIWAAFLPMIAISALSLHPLKRQIFTYLYSGYLVLQYIYWTKLFDNL